MKENICGKGCMTNEEYKKYIKVRIWISAGFILAGILAVLLPVFADSFLTAGGYERMGDFYQGFGMGLMGAGIVMLIKNLRVLSSEEKLKRCRIAYQDERNRRLSASALQAALYVLLIGIYLLMLIGGLWYPQIAVILAMLVCLFLVAFAAAYWIFSKRM